MNAIGHSMRDKTMRMLTDKGFNGSWIVKVIFGRGAGYIGMLSATFYIAYKSGSIRYAMTYRGHKPSLFTRATGLEIGLTRNANKVPYCSH